MNSRNYEETAKAYIENNKTVSETAQDLGISKRTLQIHLKKIKEINPELYRLVLAKRESQIKQGRIKGGTIGKRNTSHNIEEIKAIAETMLKEGLTYTEAEERFNIPKSTIYELLHSPKIDRGTIGMLDTLAEANQRNMTTAEYIESKRSRK